MPGHTTPEPGSARRRSVADTVRLLRARAATADPEELADALRALGHRTRWGVVIVLIGRTLDALVSAVLLVTTTARLALVEVVPALWLGAITWDWRARSSGELPLPAVHGWVAWLVAALVISLNLGAYWCNAVLAFALREPPPIRLRDALASAREHRTTITTWALAIGTVHVFVSVVLARTSVAWYGAGMTVVVVAQMYALVALPVSLAGLSLKGVPLPLRFGTALTTAALTMVALAPGLVLTRVAVGLLGPEVPVVGAVVLVIAITLQVAATSSVHTVALATKLQVAATQGRSGRDDELSRHARPEPQEAP